MKVKRILEFEIEDNNLKCEDIEKTLEWVIEHTMPVYDKVLVGDVLINPEGDKCVVTGVTTDEAFVMFSDGSCGAERIEKVRRTGLRIGTMDVNKILKSISEV